MRTRLVGSLAVIVIVGITAIVPAAGQERVSDRSARVPVRLRVDTLASFINNVAGLRVRVVDGVVDKIASPRVFTLKYTRSIGAARAAIVLVDSEATIRVGAPVTVTGIARTLLGTELGPQQPSPAFTEQERQRIDALPIVVASAIDTPDGVQLLRPASAQSSPDR